MSAPVTESAPASESAVPTVPAVPRGTARYIIVLGALVALGPFTIDLYLPAFPMLADSLQTSEAAVQLTLTGTILGFAIGQLLIGPLSDALGRKRPLLLTTSIHIIASLACALAPNVEVLAAARFLQGIGAAGSGVVAMAMVRDMYSGHAMVKAYSRMALVSGLAPIIAPVLGSQLLLVTDWRGVFGFLLVYGVTMLLVASLVLRETRPRSVREADPNRGQAWARYKVVFTDRRFVGFVLIGGFNFSGLMAYLSSSTFLFQDVYGFSQQQYGLLFAVNSVAVIIGTQTTGRLARSVGPQWILAGSTALMLVSGATIFGLHALGAGLVGVLVPLWFFVLGAGLSFPAIQVLALAEHAAEAGTAASLLGAVNFGASAAIPPIIGILGSTSAATMAIVMISCAAGSIIVLWTVVRPKSVPELIK